MKARHIRKLRKIIQTYKEYIVVPTYGLFGDFHTLHCLEGVCVTFKAENPHRAIRKYFRYYCRKYKQHHRFAFDCLTEVSEDWGKLKVKDVNSGFVYYFG